VKLYADDVLLYSHIKSETDCQSLQEDLEALVQWVHDWQIELNFQKCELLRTANKKNPLVFNYRIASKPIRQVSHTKYLGVTIASDLSWNKHVQTITNKARQVNNFLYRNLHQCPTHIKCSCYKIMVRPIVEYAATIWDPHTFCNIGKIESVQRRGARFCFNDFFRFSSVTEMLSSLNLPSLQSKRTQTKSIALYKMINGLLTVPTHDLIPKS